MNIKKMSIDELEQLSHADIAYEILKQNKKAKNTAVLFGEICKLLKIDDETKMDMISDFYTNLTTDKRFVLLDNGKWDLKEFHVIKPIIDDEDEEEEEQTEEETSEEEQEETEDEAVIDDEDDFDDADEDIDDLDDLVVVTEEELEE